MATTVCHPQHCGHHSLLSIALDSHIPIPTAERPALLLTTATWRPTSASQDAIATKFHNRVPTPCFPETQGTSRQTSSDHTRHVNLVSHSPTAQRHLWPLPAALPTEPDNHYPQHSTATARNTQQVTTTSPRTGHQQPTQPDSRSSAHSAQRPAATVHRDTTTTFYCIKLQGQPLP